MTNLLTIAEKELSQSINQSFELGQKEKDSRGSVFVTFMIAMVVKQGIEKVNRAVAIRELRAKFDFYSSLPSITRHVKDAYALRIETFEPFILKLQHDEVVDLIDIKTKVEEARIAYMTKWKNEEFDPMPLDGEYSFSKFLRAVTDKNQLDKELSTDIPQKSSSKNQADEDEIENVIVDNIEQYTATNHMTPQDAVIEAVIFALDSEVHPFGNGTLSKLVGERMLDQGLLTKLHKLVKSEEARIKKEHFENIKKTS
jgi:hypothetical protein